MRQELFHLEMLEGSVERRYQRLRPELARMPWGTLRTARLGRPLVEKARVLWTQMAFFEHKTAAAIAGTVEALIAARAAGAATA